MAAVLLACLSALLFGSMTVALRIGLRSAPDAGAATLGTIVPALAVALAAAVIEATRPGDLGLVHVWPFVLAGILAPGGSQLFFTLAVREAGPSRSSVVVGMAPLISVVIALVFLGEPLEAPLVLGALLIVAGGVALVAERTRPEHFRMIGLGFAAVATLFFATRDNLVRHLLDLSGHSAPGVAAAATLLTGTGIAVLWYWRSGSRATGKTWLRFVPAGLFFGLSYVCLFEAFSRSRVSVVAPLVATESLWGVVLSALVLGRSELVGPRLVAGAALVVAGGVLIGAFR